MRKIFFLCLLVLCLAMPVGAKTLYIAGVTGGSAADTTAPTLSSATIGTNGTTWTLVFSESVSIGTGGNGGWSVTMATAGSVTLTYSSGSGSNTLVYTSGTTVNSGDTASNGLDYTQPGNGVEDSSGNDLATINDATVTNNSTQGGTSYLVDLDFESTGVSWDGTLGTEVTAGNVDTNGEWCDADSTTTHYHGGSQGLYLFGTSEQAYVEEGLGDSYYSLVIDEWIRPEDASTSYLLQYRSASDYTYQITLYSAGQIRILVNGGVAVLTTVVLSADTWTHIRIEIVAESADGNDDGEINIWASTTDTDFDGDTANYTNDAVDTCNTATTIVRFIGHDSGEGIAHDDTLLWEP